MKKFMRGMVVCLMFGWAVMVMSQAGQTVEGEETLQEAVGDIIEFELNALAEDAQNKLGDEAEQTVGLLQPVELTAAQAGSTSVVGQLLNVYYDDFAKKSENAVNTFYRNRSNTIIDETMELYDQLPAIAALADARKEDSSVAPQFENTRDSFERGLEAFSDDMRDGLADLKNEALRDASEYIDARLREYQQSLALGTPLVYSEPVEKKGWFGEIKSFAGGFWKAFKKEAFESKIDPKTGECLKITDAEGSTKEYDYGFLSKTENKGAVCRSIVDQFKLTLNTTSKRLADDITAGAKGLASEVTKDIKAKVATVPDKVKAIISGEDKLLKKAEEAQKKLETYTPLMLAAKDFDIDEMIDLLNQGVDVTKTNDNGETALLILTKTLAKQRTDRKTVYIGIIPLLKTSINIADKEGTTPLIQAAKDKSNAIIETLLENGADPSQKDKKGKTAADYADPQGKQMLSQAATPVQEQPAPAGVSQAEQIKATTDLFLELVKKQPDLKQIEQLIQAGADIDAVNDNGDTPLIIASERPRTEEAAVKLVELGADPNKTNRSGSTPLMVVSKEELWEHNPQKPDLVQALLAKNVNANAQDQTGKTALMYAAQGYNWNNVQKLLNANADVNLKDKEDRNTLNLMAQWYLNLQQGKPENKPEQDLITNAKNIIQALIDKGIDVDNQEKLDKTTPLMKFAAGDVPDIVRLLLENDALTTLKNAADQTVWNLAKSESLAVLRELRPQEYHSIPE